MIQSTNAVSHVNIRPPRRRYTTQRNYNDMIAYNNDDNASSNSNNNNDTLNTRHIGISNNATQVHHAPWYEPDPDMLV